MLFVLCASRISCLYLSIWKWIPLNFRIFLREPSNKLVLFWFSLSNICSDCPDWCLFLFNFTGCDSLCSFEHGSNKKNDCKGRQLAMTYMKNFMAYKPCVNKRATCTSPPGRKQTWFLVVHSFQVLNIAGIFWSCFLLDTPWISKEDFLSKAEMCFGGVLVAIDTVLRSLKGKYYWELIKVGCRISQGMSQKFSDQNTL